MANIKSAKKRIRVIEKKTQRNRRVKAHLKEIIKGFDAAVAEGSAQEARDFLALAEKRLLQAGVKGTIHKNAASRKVGRLTKAFVKAFGTDALKLKANSPAIPTPEEKAARKAEKEAARAEALAKKKGRRRTVAAAADAEAADAAAEPEETPVEEPETTETAEAEAPETSDTAEAEAPETVEDAEAPEETPSEEAKSEEEAAATDEPETVAEESAKEES
jgi:small subunit ribosomal protein S20